MSQATKTPYDPFGCDCDPTKIMSPEEYAESGIHAQGFLPGIQHSRALNALHRNLSTMAMGMSKFICEQVKQGTVDLNNVDSIEQNLGIAIQKYLVTKAATDRYLMLPPGFRTETITPGMQMVVPEYTVYFPNFSVIHNSHDDTYHIDSHYGNLRVCLDNAVCYENFNVGQLLISKYVDDDMRRPTPYVWGAFSQVGEIGSKSNLICWHVPVSVNYTITIEVLDADDMRIPTWTLPKMDEECLRVYNSIRTQYGLVPIEQEEQS